MRNKKTFKGEIDYEKRKQRLIRKFNRRNS